MRKKKGLGTHGNRSRPTLRFVLFLRYYADLDYGTIADALKISGGTVGATLTQAREALLELMTEVGK